MQCAQCQGLDQLFDEPTARKELQAFRKKGPSKSTRVLLDAISHLKEPAFDLLDIGGGIGAIHHELLAKDLKQATVVDASEAYIKVSREEAQRRGTIDLLTYHHGDFVDLDTALPKWDIVTLDKVICCYHNMTDLVRKSAGKARKIYGVIYPRDSWWVKAMLPLINLYPRIKGNPYRAFVHPVREVDGIVRNQGFKLHFQRKFLFWQVVVYTR